MSTQHMFLWRNKKNINTLWMKKKSALSGAEVHLSNFTEVTICNLITACVLIS